MEKQKIEVIINCSDEEELQKMMAKAIADIVVNRIKRLSNNSSLLVEKILKDSEYETKEKI